MSGIVPLLLSGFSNLAMTGNWADIQGKPTIPSAPNYTSPGSRTLVKATAYQALDNTKPATISITLTSTSSFTLGGTVTNSANILIGPTAAVATGTGTIIGKYVNALGGNLVVGVGVTNTSSQTYTITLPVGWFFAVLNANTTTGVTIDSAFDQSMG